MPMTEGVVAVNTGPFVLQERSIHDQHVVEAVVGPGTLSTCVSKSTRPLQACERIYRSSDAAGQAAHKKGSLCLHSPPVVGVSSFPKGEVI
ncbi:hypothetical protein Y1Q_0006690 [Alligator mississippiensis]|uniref:Uncharacterized protein n=1 Tax=Alligator mississippiensis TaxID=8496 RepID=A0A151NSG9_ALLMI|nr:hypothetical protein Y1Q_0006690 [Alligator mississippiensis]